jgi:lysozyme family protein
MAYSSRFSSFMPFIFKWECDWPEDQSGQFSNDPDDPGGATKFGVDLRSASLDHPSWTITDIQNLTYTDALDIYWNDYWQRFNVEQYAFPLGEVYFNAKQNGGHPDVWIQQCKGDAGQFVDLQEQYYRDLCQYWQDHNKPDPYKFLPGWLNRTADLRSYLQISD